MVAIVAVALLLLSVLDGGVALYFHIGPGETSCFSVEAPKGKLVTAHYKVERYDEVEEIYIDDGVVAVHVTATSDNGDLILSKEYKSTGRVNFVSPLDGENTLCLSGGHMAGYNRGKLRAHIIIKQDDDISEAADDASNKLTEIEKRVKNLQQMVKDIEDNLAYQKRREEAFRHTSESVGRHVMMWPIIQVVLLGIICYIQMRHLTSFFVKKKIV